MKTHSYSSINLIIIFKRGEILMKKILLICTFVLTVSMSFVGCGQKELVKVKLNEVTRSVFYAPQYVAINEGFFKEEGIELDIVSGQGADKVMTAVLSGTSDIGFSGPEATIYVYNEGKEDHAVVFAQLTKRDGSFLVSRKPEPDFKWTNLKGKEVIGGRKGGMPEMTLEYVLKQNNLQPGKDVNVDTSVQFAVMAGAFTGGKGDYVALFEPTASIVEKEGKGYVVASIGKDSGEIPYTAYYAKKSYIEKNKTIIQKFTNAIYKGQIWVDTHSPEEIAKSVKSFFPDTDEAILINVAKRYKDQDAWSKDTVLKKDSFELLQKVMETAGELKQKAPYEKLITTEYADKSIKSIKK
jgi:NitT/TauT family transport system substrate-binding protein